MSAGAYVAGIVVTLGAFGAVGYAVEIVRRRRLAHLRGVARALAMVLLGTVGVAVSVLVPGALGILGRGSFLLCALLLACASRLVRQGETRAVEERSEPLNRTDVVVSAVAALMICAWTVALLLHTVAGPFTAVDFTSYDLPVIGRWIQTGSVWHLTELFPLQTHGSYPQNAHLVLAALILPFHNDALVRFWVYPFLPISALAVYAAGRELRAPVSTAAAFAAAFAAMPTMAIDAEVGPVDQIATACFAIGVVFLVRHARTQLRSELLLGALGVGFAAGAKWYYTSGVAVLTVIWCLRFLVQRRSAAVRDVAYLIGVVGFSTCFWLIRNLVATGDPIYPVALAVAGVKIFNPPRDIYRSIAGFSVAHYATDPSIIRHYLVPAWRKALQLPGILASGAVVWAGVTLAAARSRVIRSERLSMRATITIATVAIACVYAVTPYTAFGAKDHPTLAWVNVRYLFPALVLAMILAAELSGGLRSRLRRGIEAVTLVAALAGLRGAYDILRPGRASIAAGVIVTTAVAAIVYLLATGRRSVPRTVALPIAGLVACAMVFIGYGVQRRLNRNRYAPDDRTYAWIQTHEAGHRIGLAGSWNFAGVSPAWAMFGSQLGNQVSFVGQLSHGQLRQYTTKDRWIEALRTGDFDLVEIVRTAPPQGTSGHEVAWARSARLPVVVESPRFELVSTSSLRSTS